MTRFSLIVLSVLLAPPLDSFADDATQLQTTEVVITDFSYYLNATRTESLDSLKIMVQGISNAKFAIVACATTDSTRVIEVLDFLLAHTDVAIEFGTPDFGERAECSETN